MITDSSHSASLPRNLEPTRVAGWGSQALLVRLMSLAALYGLELLLLSIQIDTNLLVRHGGFVSLFHPGHIGRAVIAFVALSLTFGFITARQEFQRLSRELSGVPVGWPWLAGHVGAVLAFGVLGSVVVHDFQTGVPSEMMAGLWLATGVLAAGLGWIAILPWRVCRRLLSGARGVWILAAAGAVIAVGLEDFRPLLWGRMISLTIKLVSVLLHPFIPNLAANPATGLLSSTRFQLIVTPQCAGFEGAGLMLVFTVVWVLIFRKECRFPRVLFLIPASIVLAWLLNSVRLATLFLIGHAGAPAIALGGFHSQAGWIVFSGLALGFTLVLQQVPGLTKEPALQKAERRSAENPTAWYLMPLLAILATAMLTRAASGGFDWLYPLRFFAAAAVLWHYRQQYAKLDWRFGWTSAAIGGIVFVMWLVLDRLSPSGSGDAIRSSLAVMSPLNRVTWIAFRALAASVTVPIAEELAFRGYLLRRLVSAQFEKVTPASFTLVSFLLSSVAFGLLHGSRWLAGTVAGLLYAWAFRHRGRIGDAAAAHAITNALLAATVLLTGEWQLW